MSYYLEYVLFIFVFFFKQKTAYEMRISDWSSDVCSSDLRRKPVWRSYVGSCPALMALAISAFNALSRSPFQPWACAISCAACEYEQVPSGKKSLRSEEHTSELQSLMRISYAVFCLKKKHQLNIQPYIEQTITKTNYRHYI